MNTKLNETETKIYDALAPVFGGLNLTAICAPEDSATFSANLVGIEKGEEVAAAEKAEVALKEIGAADIKWGEDGIGCIWIVGSL